MKENITTRGRTLTGTVVKFKAAKTVTVEWERVVENKKYQRYFKKKSKVHAHVPENMTVSEGNEVEIQECRPISKSKKFIITRLIK